MNILKRFQPAAIPGTSTKMGSPLSASQILVLLLLSISLSLFLGILLTHQNHFSAPAYQPGDIARADIVIPMDALIEDEAATQARRSEVRANALPVFQFNPSLQEDQTARLRSAFSEARSLLDANEPGKAPSAGTRRPSFRSLPATVREQLRTTIQGLGIKAPLDDLLAFLVKEGFSQELEEKIVLLAKESAPSMLVSDGTTFAKENIHRVNQVTGKMETVSVNLLSTPSRVRATLEERIGRDTRVAPADRSHLRRIVESLIVPNLTFDEAMTRLTRDEDVKNVDHVLRKLKRGKVVLRQGDEVGPDHLVQIEAIRRLSPTGSSLPQTAGTAILIGILLTIFLFFIRFIPTSQWSYLRLAIFLIVTLTVNLLLLKGAWFVCESLSQSFLASPFNDKIYFFYLLPFAFGSMLATLLAGERCAQIFVIFFCVLAGQSLGTDIYGFFYILITNLAGIIFMRKAAQRLGLIGAGFKLGLSAALLFLILQAAGQTPQDWASGSFGTVLAFLSGPLNAIFVVFSLPLFERIFMVTTELRLSELGNLNLGLVRELMIKTPGTYNHSIAVGTLCEGAAKAIGLNPLFLRIASLYHDIGKTVHPEYFIENQHKVNPHDRMSTEESVNMLKGHVLEGVRIAKKAYLPPSIVDLIPQHHGTRLMRFFYEKAKQQSEEQEVPEGPFRYPGPKPQTKAAAILMLADGIEAAARTLNDHSQPKLLDLIRKITSDATEEGQFSECDITMSEMNRITYGFLETLSCYYHGRIAYPGFDFNQPLRANGNGAG